MPIDIVTYERLLKDDPWGLGLFRDLYRMNDVLTLFPITEVSARKVTVEKWDKLPDQQKFRDLYEDYDDSTGTTKPGEDKTAIYGGVFKEDLAAKKWTKEPRLQDPVEMNFDMHLKAMDRELTYEVIYGDTTVDPRSFDGIYKRLIDGKTVRSDRTMHWADPTGTAGFNAIASADNARTFFRQLNKVLYAMGLFTAGVKGVAKAAMLMNSDAFMGIQTAAEMANVALNSQMELFEKTWVSYRDIMFVDAGLRADRETNIIGNTMAGPDAGADCTEIYVVRLAGTGEVSGDQEGDIVQPLENMGSDGVQLIQAGSFERLGPFPLSIRQMQHGVEWQLGLSNATSEHSLGALRGVQFWADGAQP